MVENQNTDRQSLFQPTISTKRHNPKVDQSNFESEPARTPLPAFLFLHIHLSKSQITSRNETIFFQTVGAEPQTGIKGQYCIPSVKPMLHSTASEWKYFRPVESHQRVSRSLFRSWVICLGPRMVKHSFQLFCSFFNQVVTCCFWSQVKPVVKSLKPVASGILYI